MVGQAGIVDLLHLAMRRKELRQRDAVGVVLRHSHRQRLRAAQHEPRVERAENRARGVLVELQPLEVGVRGGHDNPADAVAVAVQILRRAVQHHVGAELDRPLNRGAGERVVDDELCAVAVGELGGRRQVRQGEHGVGRRLDEQQLRRRLEGAGGRVEIAGVDVREVQPVPPQDALEVAIRAAVRVVGDDDVIARGEKGGDRRDGRHARGERERALAALNRRDVGFDGRARRVLRPRVLVALVLAEGILDVRGRLEDRGDDGAGRRIGLLAGVDATGGKARAIVECHGGAITISSIVRASYACDRPRRPSLILTSRRAPAAAGRSTSSRAAGPVARS